MISGKDKGKQGKVLRVDRKLNRVLVEGVNFVFCCERRGDFIEETIHQGNG